MKLPRIAIVGGGPGGLMLGRLLQLKKIPFTIFELESGPNERSQGGSLDLHPETGQLAIEKAGLMNEFELKSRLEGDCMKLVSSDGRILLDEKLKKSFENYSKPEIDRVVLKDLLLKSLDLKHIIWGKKLQRVDAVDDTYSLNFSDGTAKAGYDMVVGADGAWSKVRPLVTDVKPQYSSVTLIELNCNNVRTASPWLSDYVGEGSCCMFDENRTVMAQRNGNNSVKVYVGLRKDVSWSKNCGIDWSDKEHARQQLIEKYFSDCDDDVKSMVLESKDELIVRPLYMLPIGISWMHRKGITLIGDAAHLMTPFAGVGVNLALFDAWKLVESIEKNGSNYSKGIVQYEQSMFERSKEHAQETWNNLETFLGHKGGEKCLEFFQGQ
mmetsp:Transcript_7972/g.7905  ORF Transcript_7972/g.7905 Transcript_7972/m.7905 type:complete len:382 (+) Transcript_7972:28-1173(+)